MENGNIRDYVRKNSDVDRMRLLCEVASGTHSVCSVLYQLPLMITPGMEFLHENGIVHGDLCGVSRCHITRFVLSHASYLEKRFDQW